MRQLRFFVKRYTLVVVLLLFTSSILAEAQRVAYVDMNEVNTIWAATEQYIFLGKETSNLVETIQKASSWSQETTESLQELNNRLQQGYKTAPKELVLEALADTCDIVEKYHNNISDDAQVASIVSNLEQCCDMVKNDRLTIQKSESARAPREPEEAGIEETTPPEDEGTAVCCELPRDVNVDRNLFVGGDLTVDGDVIINGSFIILGDLEICQNLLMKDSTSAAVGNILKAGTRFVNNFGTNNTFVGKGSGNFTLTTASENAGFGTNALAGLTTGDCNTATGHNALIANTTGDNNSAFGGFALDANVVGDDNTAVGCNALSANIATGNTAVGARALDLNTTGTANVAVGADALGAVTTGSSNTAVGFNALIVNTATGNAALGTRALSSNTTGINNVAVGNDALRDNVTGGDITAVGAGALLVNTAGSNTGIGARALFDNTTGTNNVAVGSDALGANITGATNTALGSNAGGAVTTGSDNVIIGESAAVTGTALTTGSDNIVIGRDADVGAATRANAILLQSGSGTSTSADNQIRIGFGTTASTTAFVDGISGVDLAATPTSFALINTSGQLGTIADDATLDVDNLTLESDGDVSLTLNADADGSGDNVACVIFQDSAVEQGRICGDAAASALEVQAATGNELVFNTDGANTRMTITSAGEIDTPDTTGTGLGSFTKAGTLFLHNFGTDNTFLGSDAGNLALTGSGNLGVGEDALTSLTSGSDNVALGAFALDANNTGIDNTAVGANALTEATTGGANTAVGARAGDAITIANFNTAVGADALSANETGICNTAVGAEALLLCTGANNVAIGCDAGDVLTTGSNNILIGTGTQALTATTSDEIHIGNGSTATCRIDGIRGVVTANADAIAVLIDSTGQLGTVSSAARYKENIIDLPNSSEEFMNLRPVEFNYKADESQTPVYGLIADEVEPLYPDLVVYNADGEVETIKYHLLYALLIQQIQENRKLIEELQAQHA